MCITVYLVVESDKMNTQAEINWITQYLQRNSDPSLIQYFKNFILSLEEVGDSQRMTIEEYNKEIDEAEAQIEAGNFITQEDLEKESETW